MADCVDRGHHALALEALVKQQLDGTPDCLYGDSFA